MSKNNMVMIDSLDKLQRIDHDTLVKLNANFESFLLRYYADMKDLKDGTTTRINNLDTRVQFIERVHEHVDPEKAYVRFEKLESDFRDFKRMWKAAQIIVIIFSAVIGSSLSILANFFGIFSMLRK